MRPFRFPRSSIFFMLLVFAGTLFAIEQGRAISHLYSGDALLETTWQAFFGPLLFLAALMCSVGAIGFVILHALHQSGIQRFPNLRTWTARR